MRKWTLACVLCAAVFCLALVGCGGGGGQNAAKNFIGTWELSSMEAEGDSFGEEDLAMLKGLGLNVTLSMSEDKSFALDFMGEAINGTWEAKDANTVTLNAEDTLGTIDGTLADGKLTIEVGGDKIVFIKSGDAPSATAPKDDKANDGTDGDKSADKTGDSDSDSTAPDGAKGTEINKTIGDDDVCTIVVMNTDVDFANDPGYNLKVTNKTDKVIYVTAKWGTFSVNGKMIDPSLGETIQPGKYVETFMYFDDEKLGGGTEALVQVEGVVEVYDDDSWDVLGTYDMNL